MGAIHTVDFLLLLHKQERVIVDIAMKMNIRPKKDKFYYM